MRDARRIAPEVSWFKGLHEIDSSCSSVARSPVLLAVVQELLGDDVLLWSSRVIEQEPGVRHRWHADFEALTWPTVDVWIGLRHVGRNSYLSVFDGSHQWGLHPQWVSAELDLTDDESVAREASRLDPTTSRRDFPMEVGEAFVFDGRIWHASQTLGPHCRSALLLQYAPASAEPRILKESDSTLEWHSRRPGCLLVAGTGSTLAPSNMVIEPWPLRHRRFRRIGLRWARRLGLHRVRRGLRGRLSRRNPSAGGS